MKSIQQLIALGLMIFLSITVATAQRGNKSMDPEAMAKQQTERMTENLSLNESQTNQVAAINLSYVEKMQAAKANTTGKEATQAAMENLRTEKSAAIKAVLTPEQLATYEARGKRNKVGKGKGNYKGGKYAKTAGGQQMGTPQERAQQQTERMTDLLSLNESQTEQVAAINLSYAEKMQAAKANTTGKEATQAAMKNLRTEKSAAIKAVLTPEQLATYEARGNRNKAGKGKGRGKGDCTGKGKGKTR